MIKTGFSRDKRILLINREPKIKNDRTWCFWETGNGFFEEIVYKTWDKLDFFGENYDTTLHISPYRYKMIRGIDFYNYCFEKISSQENIEVLYAECGGGVQHKDGVTLVLNNKPIELEHGVVFNSIYNSSSSSNGSIEMLQHFKGWLIETNQPYFDEGKATLMDFRISQKHGTAFVYVLPFTKTSALVEYTLFTKGLLSPEEYDAGLKEYIESFLGVASYVVSEQEFGVIPMTDKKFSFYHDGAFQIGTAGGQTKSSSGYTFQFIQKHSQQIMEGLIAGQPLTSIPGPSRRFRFYDNVFLNILYHNRIAGKQVFTDLFKKNNSRQVLSFLDNESSVKDELKIISSLPTLPFLRAAISQL